jgi:hypothetical protein
LLALSVSQSLEDLSTSEFQIPRALSITVQVSLPAPLPP